MPQLQLHLEGELVLERLKGLHPIRADDKLPIQLLFLKNGMTDEVTGERKPSVVFEIYLPDGKIVLAETSLRVFQRAATISLQHFGDYRNDSMPIQGGNGSLLES